MADGVDAAVHPMQPPASDPPVDRAPPQTEGAQLGHRDDPMLSLGERRHARIPGSAKKYMTVMDFLAHPANRPGPGGPHPSSMTVFPRFRREAVARRRY
jgi:hypothetical protein